mmetsp:Transcript_131059/g.227841  ORF Transcript_131059/g.227841 Transcript_131059/m.227841 type:complete len:249 (+) Transcript_131059:24-770(+)
MHDEIKKKINHVDQTARVYVHFTVHRPSESVSQCIYVHVPLKQDHGGVSTSLMVWTRPFVQATSYGKISASEPAGLQNPGTGTPLISTPEPYSAGAPVAVPPLSMVNVTPSSRDFFMTLPWAMWYLRISSVNVPPVARNPSTPELTGRKRVYSPGPLSTPAKLDFSSSCMNKSTWSYPLISILRVMRSISAIAGPSRSVIVLMMSVGFEISGCDIRIQAGLTRAELPTGVPAPRIEGLNAASCITRRA